MLHQFFDLQRCHFFWGGYGSLAPRIAPNDDAAKPRNNLNINHFSPKSYDADSSDKYYSK